MFHFNPCVSLHTLCLLSGWLSSPQGSPFFCLQVTYILLLSPAPSAPPFFLAPSLPFHVYLSFHALYEYIHMLTTVCKHTYLCVCSNTNWNLGSISGRTSSMKLSSGFPMQGVVCTFQQTQFKRNIKRKIHFKYYFLRNSYSSVSQIIVSCWQQYVMVGFFSSNVHVSIINTSWFDSHLFYYSF